MGFDHTCRTATLSRRQTRDDNMRASELPLTEEDRHDGEKEPQGERSEGKQAESKRSLKFPTVEASETLSS